MLQFWMLIQFIRLSSLHSVVRALVAFKWGVQLVSCSWIGRLQHEQFFAVCCSMYVVRDPDVCGTYVCLLHRYNCIGCLFNTKYFRMTRLDTCAHTVCPKPCSTTCDL